MQEPVLLEEDASITVEDITDDFEIYEEIEEGNIPIEYTEVYEPEATYLDSEHVEDVIEYDSEEANNPVQYNETVYSNEWEEVTEVEEEFVGESDTGDSQVGNSDSPDSNSDNQSQRINESSDSLYYEQVLEYLEHSPTDSDVTTLSLRISENSKLITEFNNNMVLAEKNTRNLFLISITISLVTLGALVGTVVFSKINP